MIDREKIIKALERCLICDTSVVATPEAQKAYRECEYTVGLYCGQKRVLQDVMSLIEEQQEQIEQMNFIYGFVYGGQVKEIKKLVRCNECKHRDPENHKCDCGHDIRWQLPRADDWFCADGEQK